MKRKFTFFQKNKRIIESYVSDSSSSSGMIERSCEESRGSQNSCKSVENLEKAGKKVHFLIRYEISFFYSKTLFYPNRAYVEGGFHQIHPIPLWVAH